MKVLISTIEWKKDIFTKLENGVHLSDLTTKYSMAKSTISNNDAI